MQFLTRYVPAGSAYVHRMTVGQGQFNNAEFEYLTAMWMEIGKFPNVTPCRLVIVTDVSDEHNTSRA